jgi:hypothetical protein
MLTTYGSYVLAPCIDMREVDTSDVRPQDVVGVTMTDCGTARYLVAVVNTACCVFDGKKLPGPIAGPFL